MQVKAEHRRRGHENWKAEQQRQAEQQSRAEQGTASAPPPKKKIRRHQTAAHLCQYSTIDSEVTVGQAVSVGQVVDVIAEMSWS